jgi:hypothetical protein
MLKKSLALFAILTVTAVVYSEAQSTRLLTAPSFYIAASGEYNKYSTNLDVKGASNLPPGSRLSVTLSDFVGFASTILSEDTIAVLNKDGFFQVTLKPLHGKQFKRNMVCEISFDPNAVRQDASVLKITGTKGELLGIDNNPQIGKKSGENYYLRAFVQIP